MLQLNKDKLEALVDGNSLGGVIDALAEICYEKAEHIQASYSDEHLAAKWNMAAAFVRLLSSDPSILAVSK